MRAHLVPKMRAMAQADESPQERDIARAMLADAGIPIEPPSPPAPPAGGFPPYPGRCPNCGRFHTTGGPVNTTTYTSSTGGSSNVGGNFWFSTTFGTGQR